MTTPSVNHAQRFHSRRVIRWLLSRDAQVAGIVGTEKPSRVGGRSELSTGGDKPIVAGAVPEMLDAVAGSEFVDDRIRLRE
jgi:hypothetical protein